MGIRIDMVGKKFGRLTVLKEVGRNKYGHVLWLCMCDCGIEKIINGSSLREGFSKSCGCLRKELTGKRAKEMIGKKIHASIGLERSIQCLARKTRQ